MTSSPSSWVLPTTLPVAAGVTLRHVTQRDAEALALLWRDEQVRAHLGGVVPEPEARRRGRAHVCRAGSFVVDAPGRSAAGLVMVGPHTSGDLEISFLFLPSTWGHGHAGTAVRAVVAWAFRDAGLLRLIAVTRSSNGPSLALLARSGFALERELVEFGAQQQLWVVDQARWSTTVQQGPAT